MGTAHAGGGYGLRAPRGWHPAQSPVPRRLAVPLLVALLLTGCGSASPADLPPAQTTPLPTPDVARRPAPAGRVVRVAPDDAGLGDAVGVGDRIAVVQARPAALLLLDARGRVRARTALPGPAQSAPVEDRGDVLLAAGDRVLRIDPATGSVVARLDRRATAIARVDGGLATLDPAQGTLTVAPEAGAGTPVRIPVGAGATGVVRVGEGGEIAVLDGRARTVTLLDARTGERLGRTNAGVAPTRLASRGRWLWVTDTRGGAVLVFSVARRELLIDRRVFVPGGHYALLEQLRGSATPQERTRLQVLQTQAAQIGELTANGRPNQLARRDALPDARGLAFAPGAGVLAVTSGGRVQLVDLPAVDPEQADDVPEG